MFPKCIQGLIHPDEKMRSMNDSEHFSKTRVGASFWLASKIAAPPSICARAAAVAERAADGAGEFIPQDGAGEASERRARSAAPFLNLSSFRRSEGEPSSAAGQERHADPGPHGWRCGFQCHSENDREQRREKKASRHAGSGEAPHQPKKQEQRRQIDCEQP